MDDLDLSLRAWASLGWAPVVAMAWLNSHGDIAGRPEGRDMIGGYLLVFLIVWWLGPKAEAAAKGPSDEHARGSAAWGTKKQVKELTQPLEPGGFIVGTLDRKELIWPARLAQQHLLVCGAPGTGKTRAELMPNAARALGSVVATDPKGELWAYTSGYHPRSLRFAPRDPDHSEPFNWIPLCTDVRLATLLAAAAMQEEGGKEPSFWVTTERALCAGLFAHAATSSTPTPATAWSLLGTPDLAARLAKSDAEPARRAGLMLQREGRAAGNVIMGVEAKLAWLQEPAVRRFTSSSLEPPDFAQLGRERTALYWVLHERDVAVLQPLTCLFFTLLLDELTSAPGRVPTTFLLDEFANLGRLPAFASTISLARGRGLSLVLGLQALGQLEAVYGRDAATILTCCSSKIFLHGADYQTADYVSNSLGDATVGERTRSHSRTGQSTSYHQTGRPLLTADEVRQIGTDQLIVLAENKPPLLLTKQSWQAKPKPAEAGCCGEAQGWQPVA